MKALDTPVLLALLAGEARALALLKKWRGEEVVTTELNLLELAAIAGRGAARHRAGRGQAIGRLRRRLTVLPVERTAVEEASRRLIRGGEGDNLTLLTMLAVLETNGCDDLVTDDPSQIRGKWRFRCAKL